MHDQPTAMTAQVPLCMCALSLNPCVQVLINGNACTLNIAPAATGGGSAESVGDDIIRVSTNQPTNTIYVAPATGTTV